MLKPSGSRISHPPPSTSSAMIANFGKKLTKKHICGEQVILLCRGKKNTYK